MSDRNHALWAAQYLYDQIQPDGHKRPDMEQIESMLRGFVDHEVRAIRSGVLLLERGDDEDVLVSFVLRVGYVWV